MKYLAIVLFCLFAVTNRATAQARATFGDRQTTTMTLQSAPYFAMGGVGYGGQRSFGERALRDLARFEDAAFGFETVLDNRNASRAGQLYALLGLRWTNERAFRERIAPFLLDKTPLEVRGGCFVFRMSVNYIAQEIERGAYKRPLVLNYIVPSIAAEARWHQARLFAPFYIKTELQTKHHSIAQSQRLQNP